jgi:hypothetical protein
MFKMEWKEQDDFSMQATYWSLAQPHPHKPLPTRYLEEFNEIGGMLGS